jgi:hypothetical protein
MKNFNFSFRAKDAQCCGYVGSRTVCRVLEAAQEARIDVLRHACEKRRVHARKAGHESGIHREWQWFTIRHAVLVQDVS